MAKSSAAYHGTRARRFELNTVLVGHQKGLETIDDADKAPPHCSCCCSIPQNRRTIELRKRRRWEDFEHCGDSNAENENDPHYQFFLKHLKGSQKSYLLKYQKQGSSLIIKYEGGLLEEDKARPQSQPQPTRILRSAMKKKDTPPSQPPTVKKQTGSASHSTLTIENLSGRKLRNNPSRGGGMDPEYGVMDPEYHTFLQGDISVYDENYAIDSKERMELLHMDDCSSDVEILEHPPLLKGRNQNQIKPSYIVPVNVLMNNLKTRSMQSEFREQLINLLVKPYDEKEYEKLQFDIGVRKPEVRHLDLRNGREKSCSKSILGKSYLDYHQDLKGKLSKYKSDKPKCLNLLRGYFFWVQNSVRSGSFQPWRDAECLAVRPGLVFF